MKIYTEERIIYFLEQCVKMKGDEWSCSGAFPNFL